MAETQGPARVHDRHGRRRPFSNWMKRFANLKSSNADGSPQHLPVKGPNSHLSSKGKKTNNTRINLYPLSSPPAAAQIPDPSTPSSLSECRLSYPTRSKELIHTSPDGHNLSGPNAISRRATISTNGETAISDIAASKTGTSATAARTEGGANSTFSSPAPSVRSLATTLTTVQSLAGPGQGNTGATQNSNHPTTTNSTNALSHFSHQFPSSAPAATALPAHLADHLHPTTYTSATANNALTDNASILTLASSSKRRRRNSLDTNASIRALAPASMFGGSRESLPLSVLSGIVDPSAVSVTNASGVLPRPSLGLASAERASLYSSSGVAPALTSDRNSYYAGKQAAGDGGSIRSGLPAHGRNDSMTNSIGGGPNSPLASPLPVVATGKVSRRGSGWVDGPGGEMDIDKDKAEDTRSEEVRRPR